jgi:hypothetical protein
LANTPELECLRVFNGVLQQVGEDCVGCNRMCALQIVEETLMQGLSSLGKIPAIYWVFFVGFYI